MLIRLLLIILILRAIGNIGKDFNPFVTVSNYSGPHCMLALAKQLHIKCNLKIKDPSLATGKKVSEQKKHQLDNKTQTVALLLRILFLRFFLFYVFPPLLSFSQPTQNINPHTYFVNVTFNLYTQLTFISLNVFSLLISHPLLFNTFHL
eukprot:gene3397-2350_t